MQNHIRKSVGDRSGSLRLKSAMAGNPTCSNMDPHMNANALRPQQNTEQARQQELDKSWRLLLHKQHGMVRRSFQTCFCSTQMLSRSRVSQPRYILEAGHCCKEPPNHNSSDQLHSPAHASLAGSRSRTLNAMYVHAWCCNRYLFVCLMFIVIVGSHCYVHAESALRCVASAALARGVGGCAVTCIMLRVVCFSRSRQEEPKKADVHPIDKQTCTAIGAVTSTGFNCDEGMPLGSPIEWRTGRISVII